MNTWEFIKSYLQEHGEAYPLQVWRGLKLERKAEGRRYPQKHAFDNYWTLLKKINQIEPSGRTEINPKYPQFTRVYYRLTSLPWTSP
jgi:hypothetical protein